MFVALPEAGKSVLTVNATACGSIGAPLFGLLEAKQNIKTAYIQLEGSRDEQISRMKAMESKIPFDVNNISWHTPYIIAESEKTWDPFFKEIDESAPFDLAIFDPAYKATIGGLKKEESAMALIKFLDSFRAKFGCAIILNHHAVKESYSQDNGQVIKKADPFYGSQWLKAYVDVSYTVERKGKDSISLTNTKDRPQNVLPSLTLDFDIYSYTLKANEKESAIPANLRIRQFLKLKFGNNSFTVNQEICRECRVSLRHLQRMKADGDFDDLVFFNEKGKELVWNRKL